MQNPFTTTFSKMPEYTYIATDKTEEILNNYSYEYPSESAYKITGVRGSGKTVILTKVEETLRASQNEKSGWIVLDINPTRNMLQQIAASLDAQGLSNKKKRDVNVKLSASVLGLEAGLEYSDKKDFFDIGIEVEKMIKNAQNKKKKIFIGIDEVSRSDEMIKFASEYGKWLRAGYPVYLVCTGLYENIQELSNVKNLTFFRRATTIQTEPLNFIRVAEMYKNKLEVSSEEARKLAKLTKGYAYAYQQLGVLCFKNKGAALEDIIQQLKSDLFSYSYEKIWEEMSEMDRFLATLLTEKEEYKREEILVLMGEKSKNYSMYRDRLMKRGIIKARKGYISLALPYFADYIKEYC